MGQHFIFRSSVLSKFLLSSSSLVISITVSVSSSSTRQPFLELQRDSCTAGEGVSIFTSKDSSDLLHHIVDIVPRFIYSIGFFLFFFKVLLHYIKLFNNKHALETCKLQLFLLFLMATRACYHDQAKSTIHGHGSMFQANCNGS